MKNFKKVSISILLLLAVSVSACQKKETTTTNSTVNAESSKKTISIGVSQGPYNELFNDAVQPILEKQGYTVTRIDFQDLIQSEIALSNNEVDFNVAQHTAYVNNFNAKQNAKLTVITPIPTVPAGIFSETNTSLEQIKDGAKIAIPNDASNTARAYLVLEKAGWIKLDKPSELLTTTSENIVENPFNIVFTEMESLNIPRSLPEFDFAVIPGSIVYNAKIDSSTVLLQEDVLKELELVVVVNEQNKDSEWAKAIVDAYHSDDFKKYMTENNKDNFWFIPEELK